MGSHSTVLFDSDLVKFSKLYQELVFVHAISDTDNNNPFQDNSMITSRLKHCSKSIVKKKFIRRMIKHCATMAALAERKPENYYRRWLSVAKFVSGQLPEVIILQNVYEGKIVFKKSLIRQIEGLSYKALLPGKYLLQGLELNSRPEFYPDENSSSSTEAEAPSFSETGSLENQDSEYISWNGEASLKDKDAHIEKVSLKSISVIRRELPESTLGWPLLPRTSHLGHATLRRSKARSMSLVEWIMYLPNRRNNIIPRNHIDSESDEAIRSSGNMSVSESSYAEDEENSLVQAIHTRSVSGFTEKSTGLTPGWPLLRIKTSAADDSTSGESESTTTGLMSESTESTQYTPESQIVFSFKEVESSADQDFCHWEAPGETRKKAKLVRKLKSSGCKQFSFEELERATRNFSSGNLIGEGGCSNVFKGSLRWGKLVAVKVLKQYKEAWNDFSLEVEIVSSLKHKRITNLIGVCIEHNHLILVYNFLSRGSLEEILQGHNTNSVLPWKTRFKVAIAVAEALDYLHSESSRPIIHRDVKSSNILLSDDFQPQLSDLGLATWGPEDSAYMISNDIVGTFGYIAPEYFMNGKISEKTDIYSFGIVLLELLTGKKPIISEGLKGQESLVKWAAPLLESGNLEALLDPRIGKEFDHACIRKMVVAATFCIKQSPRLRPKANQILELLREDKELREWTSTYINDLHKSAEEIDDFFPELDHKLSSDSPSLVLDDATSLSSTATKSPSRAEYKHRFSLKDYLQKPHD